MNTPFFNISPKLAALSDQAECSVQDVFAKINAVTAYNQQKMLAAFIENKVSESHFNPTTGYGYGDRGRDALDAVFAQAMGAEDALVRHSILSGTHAITIALFGILRPGDTLLAATGAPYDTLRGVVSGDGNGSLRDFGVRYTEIPLRNGRPDIAAIGAALEADPTIKMVHIQRSRGYSLRPSLTVAEIGELIIAIKKVRPEVVIFVDNCYGEFVETVEPVQVSADLTAGSLIKNPGGGIAENGGYICGRRDLVELCAQRMTAPGLGREIGASLGHNRSLFMGLWNAPHAVGEAMKTAVYAAALFRLLGFEVSPAPEETRGDIVQVIKLGGPERLIAFCRGLQGGSPVDSFVTPEPWDMPGYGCQVIMAAGAFTMGSSLELSADAPLREPYAVYMQGGTQYHAGKLGVLLAAEEVEKVES